MINNGDIVNVSMVLSISVYILLIWIILPRSHLAQYFLLFPITDNMPEEHSIYCFMLCFNVLTSIVSYDILVLVINYIVVHI